MQCRQCGFENMPGLTVCMRCNSTLVATAKVNVHPPRAGWTRVFRPLRYRLNPLLEAIPLNPGLHLDRFLGRFLFGSQSLLWAGLSVVPGLGHLCTGRLKEARGLLLVWAVTLGAGLFLFGMNSGSMLLGLTIGLHGWIICDAGRFRQLFSTFLGRFFIVGMVTLCIGWPGYHFLQLYVEANHVRGVMLTAPVASDRLLPGDFLLARPKGWSSGIYRRGDVVIYSPAAGRAHGVVVLGGETIGKLLALPGEHMELGANLLTVVDRAGKRSTWRLPQTVNCPELEIDLPQDRCFCLPSAVTRLNRGYDRDVTPAEQLILTGLAPIDGIKGRLFMLYNPFWRRTRLPAVNP